MSSTPLSVALPVYNGADYIREALDSILAQSHGDFTLVVSDNCSTDDTPAILAEYAARDPRVRVSRSEKFLGQADNINRAVRLCDTEWIKLFCHDDLMDRDCLRVIHEIISIPDIDRVGLIGNNGSCLFKNGYVHSFGHSSGPRIRRWYGREAVAGMLSGNGPAYYPAITSAAVRRSAFAACGGFDGRYVHFDVFYWARLLMDWDLIEVSDLLTTTRIHGSQVAVSARTSLRTVEDNRRFWPEFLATYGDQLQLDSRARFRVRLKPVSAAASFIAIELMKGNVGRALQLWAGMPLVWQPLLPPVVAFNYKRERSRIRDLSQNVNIHMIHP